MQWNRVSGALLRQNHGQHRRQRGAAIAEFVVVLPALLLLGLGSLQSALFYQAKTTATYATFEAARKGATTHALKTPMLSEFGLRLAPVFGGDGSDDKALAAILKGQTEARDPGITRLDIINPTHEAFLEFGQQNPEIGKIELPNAHLKYRDASFIGQTSGVNIQDANLLKIKTTYGFALKVPLVNTMVAAALKRIDPQNAKYYDQNRIPITAVATVRMQSEAWENGNLMVSGAVPGGGAVPNGEMGEGGSQNGNSDDTNGDDPGAGQGNPLNPVDPFQNNGDSCNSSTQTCLDNPGNQGDPNSCSSSGTGQSRQTAQVTGLPATGTGNPIHVISGNKYQVETDFPALPGTLGLVWQRHYNSQSAYRGTLGSGWRHSYDVQVRRSTDGIRLIQADGRHILFQASNEGRYESTLGSDGWLTVEDSTQRHEERVVWHWRTGQQLQFNASGQLTDITLPTGDTVRLQYNDQQNLFLVRDAQDRELSLGYYPNGRLQSVRDTTGQALRYAYDDRGNLAAVTYADDSHRAYHYEDPQDPNNLTGITDQRGIRFATWEYDENDRAISSEHADGVEKVTIDYSDDGTRLITNSLGEVSSYSTEIREGLGVVTQIAGPGCSSCSASDVHYEYDAQLQLVSTLAKDRTETVREYDVLGRVTALTQRLPDGQTREIARYAYADKSTVPLRISKPSVNPAATHDFDLRYNAAGQMIAMLESGWSPTAGGGFEAITRQTQLSYTAGLLTRIDGPREDVDDITSFAYDTQKRLTRLNTPDGRHLRITAYDAYGRPTEIRQGQQQPTRMAYNSRGDVTAVTRRGQTLQYHYDAAGQLVKVTGPDGETLELTYDAAGRATEILGPDGRRIISDIDSEGRTSGNQLLSGQDDVLAQISYLYDAEGRLSQMQRNGETAKSLDYDDNSDDITRVTDAQGNTTGFDYSSLGDLLAITQPDGNVTRLAYDNKQHLNSVTDARQNQTRYRYNDFGQVVEQHSPDSGTTRYAYDVAGNQVSKTDAGGAITAYAYDAANRLTLRTDTDGASRYQYDNSSGRLSAVSDDFTRETFAYNRDARLIEHTRTFDQLSLTTVYAYNPQGKLVSKELPDGQQLKYHYHAAGPGKGQLWAITRDDLFGQTTILGELNTNDSATQTHWQHGNGIAVNQQTDGLGNPIAYSFSQALSLNYSYDPAGRINGIESNGQQNWYDYDINGQLIGADTGLGQFEYDYDAAGNRTGKTVTRDGRTEKTDYDLAGSSEGNRLLAVNGEEQRYNATGNPTANERFRYAYNAQQRPVKVYDSSSDRLRAEYRYNAFGARIKKVTYSANNNKKTVTYYLYDGRKLAAEVNERGKVVTQYLYYKQQPVAQLRGRTIYAIHADHLGSPQSVTNSRQQVVWQAAYAPFGEATLKQAKITLNLRLPGQYYDQETGTHYNYYRDYDPGTGRYAQSDPIGLLGGINTYAYVGNDPLQLTDVLGLAEGDETIGTGPEPGTPEADSEYTQKLQIIFDRAIDKLGDDHKGQLGKQIVEDLKMAATVMAGIAVAAGAFVAGAAAVSGGAAIPVAIGALASAAAAVGARALWIVGLQGIMFLYDTITIALDATKVDLCDDTGLDSLAERLQKRILETEASVLQDVFGFGVGNLTRKLRNVFSNFSSAKTCSFAGDTLVLTRTGYLAIREIQAGNDEVWARNAATGTMDWKPVVAQYNNPYADTVSVTTRAMNGVAQTIVSNAIHPYFARVPSGTDISESSEGHFYQGEIKNAAWIDAADLQPGYELLSANETWQTVVAVDVRAQPLHAFNLTVEDYSTYFVAANDEADAVWVHNSCFDKRPDGFTYRRGDKNALGQRIYRAPNDEQVYRGFDGRYYDPNVFPPGTSKNNLLTKKLSELKQNPAVIGLIGEWRATQALKAKIPDLQPLGKTPDAATIGNTNDDFAGAFNDYNGRNGIDGIYRDADGKFYIVESKASGQAVKPGDCKGNICRTRQDGDQLSDQWIEKRIDKAGLTKAEADELRMQLESDVATRLLARTDDTNGTRFFEVARRGEDGVIVSNDEHSFD